MRTAVLITFDSKDNPTLVCGPDVSVTEQRAAFKELLDNHRDGNDKVIKAELWTSSGGVVKRHKWQTAGQVQAQKHAAHREEALAKKAAAAVEKEQADAEKAKTETHRKHLQASERQQEQRQKVLDARAGKKEKDK